MRKFVLLLSCMAVVLQAQEEAPTPEDTTIPEIEYAPSASAASTKAAQSSGEWKNWVFAGSAAVVFTIGVLVVTLNTGTTASGH